MAMTGRLARFYPSSFGLAARIGLILVGAVVLSIGISTAFIFIVGEGEVHLPVVSAETMADKILTAYRRIDAAPAAERAAAVAEMSAPIRRIDWPVPPPPPEPGILPGYLSELRVFIQKGLDDPRRGVTVEVGFPREFEIGPPPGPPPNGPPPENQPGGGGPAGGQPAPAQMPGSQPALAPLPGPPPGEDGPEIGFVRGSPDAGFIQGGMATSGFVRGGFRVFGPLVRVSMQLGDGNWVAFEASQIRSLPFPLIDFLVRVVPISAVCLLLALFVIRGFMRPINHLAAAAERLGIEGSVSMLEEAGAPEMRAAARAFNAMQLRLRRLIDDRTQMLAAISHDLKTPITRLRLRAEFVEDPALQEKMLADLAEMEAIVASTLAFARGDARSEARESVDLADMLQSLVEARADSGAVAAYEGPAHLTVKARPVALRRALGNLIDNAIKYGISAHIALRADERQAVVEIEDEGPGIPEDQLELVFRPYYRLEGSRSRETGGVGLGLSIARAVIRADGGEVTLENRANGGLSARITLPLGSAAAAAKPVARPRSLAADL
jgi:signal transduction histidine kinase